MTFAADAKRSKAVWRAALILSVIIVAPCAYGFIVRLSRLVAVAGTDPIGAFAIIPVFNYLAASTGFVMLMVWALFHGMFRDIEKPKYDFLEREAWLDAQPGEEDDDGDDEDRGSPESPPNGGEASAPDEIRELATAGAGMEAANHG